MRLEGSCSCGAAAFSVTSQPPYPYMRCYCFDFIADWHAKRGLAVK